MRRPNGFSLVEVIFALLVLAIVIITTLAMFVERSRRLEQAAETMLAFQALSNEAEVIRRVSYDDLPALPPDQFETSTKLLDPLKPFKTSVQTKQARPGVREVTLGVDWKGGGRRAELLVIRVSTGGTNLW